MACVVELVRWSAPTSPAAAAFAARAAALAPDAESFRRWQEQCAKMASAAKRFWTNGLTDYPAKYQKFVKKLLKQIPKTANAIVKSARKVVRWFIGDAAA